MVEQYVPEELIEQVAKFKERTGLDDVAIDKIVMGGEVLARMESLAKGELAEFMRDWHGESPDEVKLHFNPQGYVDDAMHESINNVTALETIDLMNEIAAQTGLSHTQMAVFLEKSSQHAPLILKAFSEVIDEYKVFDEIQNLGSFTDLPIDVEKFTDHLTENLKGVSSIVYSEEEIPDVKEFMNMHLGNAISAVIPTSHPDESLGAFLTNHHGFKDVHPKAEVISFADRVKSGRETPPKGRGE